MTSSFRFCLLPLRRFDISLGLASDFSRNTSAAEIMIQETFLSFSPLQVNDHELMHKAVKHFD